jgi:ribosomal-protein-alanine N-acetyltransferase
VTEVSSADRSDVPEIAALAAASLQTPWSARLFEQELRLTEARLWAAREGSRIIGYLSARRIADELHILSVAVDSAHRRRGVARALLDAALGQETARGAGSALLEVRSSNLEARAFYANSGFVAVGCRPRYHANGEDALLMTRNT